MTPWGTKGGVLTSSRDGRLSCVLVVVLDICASVSCIRDGVVAVAMGASTLSSCLITLLSGTPVFFTDLIEWLESGLSCRICLPDGLMEFGSSCKAMVSFNSDSLSIFRIISAAESSPRNSSCSFKRLNSLSCRCNSSRRRSIS